MWLAKVVLAVMALVAAAWGVATYPLFINTAKSDQIALQILSGEPFRKDVLLPFEARDRNLAGVETPTARRDFAIIAFRLAELRMAQPSGVSQDPQLFRAEAAIRSALEVAPSDSFLWLALFWLIKMRDGFRPDLIPYLEMSYATGPRDGWIAARRNPVVLPLIAELPPDMVVAAIAEFRALAVAPYYRDTAADILTGPGWAWRDLLISSLTDAPYLARKELEAAAFRAGLEISVPGIEPRGQRPWR